MPNKLLIFILFILLSACSDNDAVREYGNLLGGIGRNSSFEFAEEFQYQLYNQKVIDSSSGASCPPLFLKDEKLIFATDNGKIVSALKGEKEWEFELDSGRFVTAGFSADANSNIYMIDNKGTIYSLSSTGKLRFSKQLITPKELETFNSPLSIGNSIVFSSNSGNLVFVDSTGSIGYSHKYDADILNYVSAIDTKNILITLSGDEFGVTDTLVSITPQGQENWRFSSDGYRFLKGAVTNGKNIAIAGSKRGGDTPLSKVFYLDKTGKLVWGNETSVIPRFLSMALDGETYLVSYSSGMGQMLSGIFAYGPKGKLDWKIYYDYSVPMPIYISQNDLFFLASNRKTYGLFYLQREDGKLIKMLDFGEANPIEFLPEVGDDGTLVFAGKETLRIIRVDETAMNKILPY